MKYKIDINWRYLESNEYEFFKGKMEKREVIKLVLKEEVDLY